MSYIFQKYKNITFITFITSIISLIRKILGSSRRKYNLNACPLEIQFFLLFSKKTFYWKRFNPTWKSENHWKYVISIFQPLGPEMSLWVHFGFCTDIWHNSSCVPHYLINVSNFKWKHSIIYKLILLNTNAIIDENSSKRPNMHHDLRHFSV